MLHTERTGKLEWLQQPTVHCYRGYSKCRHIVHIHGIYIVGAVDRNLIKGTVQRKLTGVESNINRKLFL